MTNSIAYPLTTLDLTPVFGIAALVLFTILVVILFFFIGRNEEYKELKASYNKMLEAFNEIDEQAKLIIKTDLELNKAQEELDRRLTGLNTLQKLARKINMTLDENEIFQRIAQPLINELGFSRALILTHADDNHLVCRINIGFEPEKAATILSRLETHGHILDPLKDGMPLSSLNTSQKTKAAIIQLFETEHFIMTALMTQQRLTGILFVGNRYNAPPVTEGDEELVSILSSQLAQTIENTQLFEQVYRSSQLMETKVNDRTRELTLALKEVEEISRKKTEFISAVSHELRTPLTSIKGYASILMTGKVGDIPEAVKERLGKINHHSDNLVKLINDLLDIARIESGRVEMNTTLQPVKPVLDNMADLLTPQLTAKGLTLRLNIPDDMPDIEFDASQFERVFINLTGNAIKFTPTGGKISINAIPQPGKQEVLFEVADTGIGIRKEDLQKIFDEFYRVDNEINMNVKGTGLGLALAKNIVEAHGGRIWVTSEVGHGTVFHVTIPLKQKPKEPRKPAA